VNEQLVMKRSAKTQSAKISMPIISTPSSVIIAHPDRNRDIAALPRITVFVEIRDPFGRRLFHLPLKIFLETFLALDKQFVPFRNEPSGGFVFVPVDETDETKIRLREYAG
jgi:hypothetical protein